MPTTTTIRILAEDVADPAIVARSASALEHKYSDLTVICTFVVIGLIITVIAMMAFPVDQDTAMLLAQFG